MRLLLNATESELANLGGDLTYYRDLQLLSSEDLRLTLLPESRARRAQLFARRVAGVMCRSWLPAPLRRNLLVRSRAMPIEPASAHSADAILSHIWYPLQGRSHGKPVIWSSQGISPGRYYEYVNRGHFDVEDVVHLYSEFGRDAAALLIWTHAGARRVMEACPSLARKVEVIPAPIIGAEDEVDVKPSSRDGVIRVLFIGTDAERKGLREALLAFESARTSVGSAQFTVVSRPPADLLTKLDATPDVRFIPSRSSVNVIELMKESDILVLPTKADTYALTAVEAMARGCAVLISDLEPLPEVVPDGKVGFVVPIGDVNALSSRMTDLMVQNSLLRTMQVAARSLYLERHSPTVFRASLEKLTAAVLRRSPLT
ncbi:MAG: glycosyltransferase family 4 protein [Candidatus Dormibacteraceae bacterium]